MNQKYRSALLDWYDANKRDLPWRNTADPYAIWVSEVMLQQTQVSTVIPYFERFMARFPTSFSLAEASEDEVMRHWSGLGYYRRARMLHEGVRDMVAQYGGVVPHDAQARRKLRGVGRYTAGAIGSIALGEPEPIVDGNVARVFARVFGLDGPLESKAMQKVLWSKAEMLVQGPRPGDLNQALMELGATVCTKHNPLCDRCPLRETCVAYATDCVARLPRPKKRKTPETRYLAALVAVEEPRSAPGKAPHIWVVKREGSLFGGLFGVPIAHLREPSTDAWPGGAGFVGEIERQPVAQIKHQLTHRTFYVTVWRAFNVRPQTQSSSVLCVRADKLDSIGVSTLTRKVITSAMSAQ